ncbi:MAG: Gfo/Idh/MocA family oxidoreductase [Anaerolineaceae bacterium]|nr:Gfo/Idh/MocA family oxidoreductase [Betaproteobacteria bacterium]
MQKHRAAVIGLGQAGSRFDEEPRGSVWSHVGAYLALKERYELVGGVDVDRGNLEAFAKRCPSISKYLSVSELMGSERPDVVSIATPSGVRVEVIDELLNKFPPKLVICEKPLATDISARQRLVDQCKKKNVILLVHYNRRYNPVYQAMFKAISEGLIGDVTSITIRCPNRLWSIGSHAFDLLFYLSGELPLSWRALPLPGLEDGEPAVDFICTFPSGRVGRVSIQGGKNILIFEADVIGTKGRLTVVDNGAKLTHIPFRRSRQYQGYWVQGRARRITGAVKGDSTFISIVREAADILDNGRYPTCTGEMALQSELILDQLNLEAKGIVHE